MNWKDPFGKIKEGRQKRPPQKTMSFQNVNRIHISLNPEQIKMIEATGLKSVQVGNKTYYEEGCDIEAEKLLAAGWQQDGNDDNTTKNKPVNTIA